MKDQDDKVNKEYEENKEEDKKVNRLIQRYKKLWVLKMDTMQVINNSYMNESLMQYFLQIL